MAGQHGLHFRVGAAAEVALGAGLRAEVVLFAFIPAKSDSVCVRLQKKAPLLSRGLLKAETHESDGRGWGAAAMGHNPRAPGRGSI